MTFLTLKQMDVVLKARAIRKETHLRILSVSPGLYPGE